MSNPIISISGKCSDLCFAELRDENGSLIVYGQGYVPDFMPEIHYGDYIILDIDFVTGKIVNWEFPDYITVINDIKSM